MPPRLAVHVTGLERSFASHASLAGHRSCEFPEFGGQPLCACLLPVSQDRVPYAGELCIAAVLASCALVVCGAEQHSEGLEVFVCGVGGEVVE